MKATAVGAFLFMLILYPVVAGWGLMLAVGIAHHEWVPDLPTIGLWPAVLIALLLRLALLNASASSSD